jgi:hypothetical protein
MTQQLTAVGLLVAILAAGDAAAQGNSEYEDLISMIRN